MASSGNSDRDAVDQSHVGAAAAGDDQKVDPYKDVVEAERAPSPELEKRLRPDYSKMDKELAQYVSDTRIDISEEENNRLRRLVDKRVLVIMITTYFLQAIDKGTMSFASIMGIIEDTGLHGQQYQWLTTCIYITILIVEYPQNWLIARVPIAKYLSFSIMAWGAVLACTAACTSFAGLVTVRTLLGLFESVCQPAFVVLSSTWYRREEQAARVTYWYMMNGAQQIVGGLLAYCFSLIRTGPLKSWQWLFMSYGIVSVIYGAFVGWWMPDSPMRAKCFTEEDKRLMVERVRANQTGVQNRQWKKHQFWEGILDPQAWGYALIQLCTTLPTSGLGSFQGLIIKSFGFSVLQTQLLAMVLGAYIIIVLLSSSWLVKKTNQNLLVMLGFVIPSFIGTICLMTVPIETLGQKVGLVICYYITLSFWSAQTLALSMLSRNVAGQTKKSVAVALNFIIWSTGNAIGPQVFLDWDKPRYFIAFATHLGCYTLLVIVILGLRFYLKYQNKKRDELAASGAAEAKDENLVHAFEDLTDKENPNFRYVY
ncbi:general substrate transporter [Thermothelomyces heterothallicus CBS 202.75]|uniref:general substrate transporter n=1 Tax=Thermothelomyces heterothallicus CBS 202.75 TaxID=1149848 RepID=UPI003742056E